MFDDIFLITLLLAAYLYWSKAQQAKELALKATRAHCLDMEVQMLDEYVALDGIGLKRDEAGKSMCDGRFYLNFLQREMSGITGKLLCWVARLSQFIWNRIDLNDSKRGVK